MFIIMTGSADKQALGQRQQRIKSLEDGFISAAESMMIKSVEDGFISAAESEYTAVICYLSCCFSHSLIA